MQTVRQFYRHRQYLGPSNAGRYRHLRGAKQTLYSMQWFVTIAVHLMTREFINSRSWKHTSDRSQAMCNTKKTGHDWRRSQRCDYGSERNRLYGYHNRWMVTEAMSFVMLLTTRSV